MVSKCTDSNVNYVIRTLCENPGLNESLDSVVPVTDYVTHYRNKFCALCNGLVEYDILQSWELLLQCTPFITVYGESLLERVVENRCNIFFKAPNYARQPRKCIPQMYKISRCNVTGLWPRYNETIDLACSAYVDSFNATYKNIFCLMCNTETTDEDFAPSLSNCVGIKSEDNMFTPLFSAVLDMNALKVADVEDEMSCDDVTQFRDDKLVWCFI